MNSIPIFVNVASILVIFYSVSVVSTISKYDKKDLENLREEVRQMFQHAYNSYLKYAYPYDELRPLSCDGVDTWGSYSLTLIDALDTLAVMGNYTEFQRVVDIVTTHANFDANINVSVFETNIRIIGGLLSAHLLSHRAGVAVEPGWPCNGPLLQLAEDVARRLIAAFDTTTGMPYGTVNLRYGVPEGETSVTCTAGVGTFILELGTLSRLTGDPLFEEVAMNALYALYNHRSPIGLVGNHIDVQTGRWTAQDAGIGAGVDSYYEYLAKGAILLQRPELMHMFHEGRAAIDKYLKRDDWHLWVSMSKGQVTLPVFQSLEAYWPGVLSLMGDTNKGIKSLHNYHQVWKQYGFTPEFYNIPQGEVGANRESYPLRPELVESVMYLYRATGDPYLLEVGKDILRSIQHSARTPCGYATIKDVRDHRKEDRMESFFLAETTKYLYLLFDPDNFIHNRGQHGTVLHTPWGECVLEAGGYIFNTEAHPIDPGALHCCSGHREADIQQMLHNLDSGAFRGSPLATHRHQQPPPPPPDTESVAESTVERVETVVSDDSVQSLENESLLEKLVAEMGGAIDVVRLSGQKTYSDKDQDTSNKGIPNVSLFEKAEELPFHLLSDGLQTSESEDIKNLKREVGDNSVINVSTSKSDSNANDDNNINSINSSNNNIYNNNNNNNNNNNEKVQKIDGNVLEYRADDSDRVYSVRDAEDIELDVDVVSSDPSLSDEALKDENNEFQDAKDESVESGTSWSKEQSVQPGHSNMPSFVTQFLLSQSSKLRFDPQVLLERLRAEAKYKRNFTWEQKYELLSCPAQPFLQRLSMSGEIFGAT